MSDIILRVENVSKQYRLGSFGTNTIGGDVHRWWTTKIRGKEDPFLKVGDVNDRTSKVKSDFVWALKDINFEVKRGEVLGIIGKNGAGKSTLLKLLSRITSPTTGSIESWGRMASLLEVGTGFHPELTGRENIFLNGAILGMTKAEVKRKLDEIIDFSGCALYIDTPVKRYSSGMTVRLGFAVAAFLDPEILIVDEVLAVGDAEFQKKAIGKMQDISRGEGRTVLFVSHNMDAVSKLCNRVVTIKNGSIKFDGNVFEGVSSYLEENLRMIKTNNKQVLNILGKNAALNEILFSAENGIVTGERLKVSLCLQNISKNILKEVRISIGLYSEEKMQMVIDNSMLGKNISLEIEDEQQVDFIIDMFPLGIGKYQVVVYIESSQGFELSWNSHSIECVSNKIFGNNTFIRNEWPQNLTFTKFNIEKT